MSSFYSERLFDEQNLLSARLRERFYNAVFDDHHVGLGHMAEKAKLFNTQHIDAISQIITSVYPDRTGYTTDLIGTLYTTMSQKCRVHTDSRVHITAHDALPKETWHEDSRELHTESFTGLLSGLPLRIGRFDSLDTGTMTDDSIVYHHAFLGIHEPTLNALTVLKPDLLSQLATLNEIVSHDYLHHFTTGTHIKNLGIETITFDDWKKSFGNNNTILGTECWHVLAHKSILDTIHPEGASAYLHQYGQQYLQTLEDFKNTTSTASDVDSKEVHKMVEYLGLCGALPYMRLGAVDSPELTEYLNHLEEIDPYPELTVERPLVYSDGANTQSALKHYRSNGVFLEHSSSDNAYLRRQQAELVQFAPLFSYLIAPPLQDQSFLQRIFSAEHKKIHDRTDAKISELFRGIYCATVTSAPKAGF